MNRKNKGLTLVEGLIWFALLAAVIVVVFLNVKSSSDKNKLTSEIRNVQFILMKMTDIKSASNQDDEKFDNLQAQQLGVFPKGMKIAGSNQIINKWGGDVIIEYKQGLGYTLTYKNVPSDVCTNFIQSLKGVGWGKIETSDKNCVY